MIMHEHISKTEIDPVASKIQAMGNYDPEYNNTTK